jgi:hypothetical protein
MTPGTVALGVLAALAVSSAILFALPTPAPPPVKGALMTAATPQPAKPALNDVSKVTGLSFPTSTQLVAFESEAGIDTSIHATIVMSSPDLAPFLAANGIDRSSLRAAMRAMLGRDVGSWTPSQAKEILAAQVQRGPGRVLNIGVSETDRQVIVYLHWFTT